MTKREACAVCWERDRTGLLYCNPCGQAIGRWTKRLRAEGESALTRALEELDLEKARITSVLAPAPALARKIARPQISRVIGET